MGEQRAIRVSIVGNLADDICWIKDDRVQITDNIVCLHSFFADKLIYVHTKAFCYNKCKFSSILEAALMIKSINGEITHDC
jgi:hypothetical protein